MSGTKKLTKGTVFICGSGPGDPKLITVRCKELIEKCDVILYDRLVGNEILKLIPEHTLKVYVGRASGDPTTNQANTNKIMLNYAREGKQVLRLKGGDPFIFGRGGEEAEFLTENQIPFEIVPGISSAIGSAIYAGIPLTHRKFSSSVAIVTGHEDPLKGEKSVKWDKLATAVDTIVILMGIENISKIIDRLINNGLNEETDIAIIERGTLPDQKIIVGKLSNIIQKMDKSSIKPPAIILIGDVVSLSQKLRWT